MSLCDAARCKYIPALAARTIADRIGSGKVVLLGMGFISAAMAVFTQVGPDTSYVLLLGALFVMGMGL
ncbi:hypothetical protein O1W68_10205 [Rhodococcus sp. H36-A4]|uniref:hypothetical protein n=1 Tax=Rhodococcus sp. H36-A4 TaxID=3004353 RepID=UPI0022B04DD0|nr:hypothetical protein [Rhodococcus sp. H36-A4]MCZ4078315.1 hypothetical protein [Rhodococcus sp. H36-A4]